MCKVLIVSYFRSISFPLAEATRIQLINYRNSIYNIVFWSSWKIKRVRDTILLPIPLIMIIFPFLVLIPRRLLRTYGPCDSRFIKLLNTMLNCKHIITEVSDSHLFYGNKAGSYEIFENPVLDDGFYNNKPSLKKDEIFRILFMSHFTKRKGLDILLEALLSIDANMQSNIELTLCDSGIIESDITTQSFIDFEENFAGKVYFKGVVDPKTELHRNDIYVYPFIKPKDTFIIPMSFLEAICALVVPVGPNFEFVETWLSEEFTCAPESIYLKSKLEDVMRNYKYYHHSTQILRKKINTRINVGRAQRNG